MAADETEDQLADIASRMSRLLLSRQTVRTVLDLLTTLVRETLPGTTGAGVTLVDAAGKRTTAASDRIVARADALQYELDEGPCLTAARDRRPVRIDDLALDRRWERWSGQAAGLGLRSMMSTPMLLGGESLGAIKAYSARPGTYGPRAVHLLDLFARQAAVLLTEARSREAAGAGTAGFTEALRDRDMVGQAKGVLIGQGAVDGDAAYALLLSTSERSNVPVREVARRVVAAATARNAGAGS